MSEASGMWALLLGSGQTAAEWIWGTLGSTLPASIFIHHMGASVSSSPGKPA